MAQGTNQDENKPQGSDLTQGVALTVSTDSPWRDSPDPHVRDAHAKSATAER